MVETVYQPYFFEKMKGLKQDIYTIKKLIQIKYPDLMKYFEDKEISIDNSLLTLIICMFTHLDIDDEVCKGLLEYIIVLKKVGLYKIILYCIKKLKSRLRKVASIVELSEEMKKINVCLQRRNVLAKIDRVEIDKKLLNEILFLENKSLQNDQYIFREEELDIKREMKSAYFYTDKVRTRFKTEGRYSGVMLFEDNDNGFTKTVFQKYRYFSFKRINSA